MGSEMCIRDSIGSHTPAEIALSLLAEIVAIKNGVELKQKKLLQEVV